MAKQKSLIKLAPCHASGSDPLLETIAACSTFFQQLSLSSYCSQVTKTAGVLDKGENDAVTLDLGKAVSF